MNELAERFRQETGSTHYLTADDQVGVQRYLEAVDYLIPNEQVIAVASAGEGNMNLTLRVVTNHRRFVLKQSRPWVAKFPQLDAPVERVLVESAFHRAIGGESYLLGRMPEIIKTDSENYVLLMEDLGAADDLTIAYEETIGVSRTQLNVLLTFAGRLHRLGPTDFPDNNALRRLNHAHIFDLPFREDNGFPLDAIYPGLGEVARPFQHDDRLRIEAARLGEIYLATGPCLIHGDYYPGSFLDADDRVYVIDAEFAHLGRPEFDIGVLMAHLLLSRSTEKRIRQIDTDYDKPSGFDSGLARRFCYIEIIRRLIGIAQLPVELSLDERKSLLERARMGLR
jgi:5-methylthioribose kinase